MIIINLLVRINKKKMTSSSVKIAILSDLFKGISDFMGSPKHVSLSQHLFKQMC